MVDDGDVDTGGGVVGGDLGQLTVHGGSTQASDEGYQFDDSIRHDIPFDEGTGPARAVDTKPATGPESD
ncbi:hypothetical protein GONAM_09_00260 [Gordonia namibiensis NBRC 108229]|uniref:Uncharacterized protein n=1 Tax=Gordonia namibiensis NBRC 108229 TaxID=1208314 RepID=K6X021_9ACTN|nr:hypothetical protein GONAM_09_00260 [Gordonia namibiensis NBRC 108229]